MQKIVLAGTEIFFDIIHKDSLSKVALAKSLAKKAFGIEIEIKKNGEKPFISNQENIFCSFSDSKDLVLVALARGFSVGVDLEYLRPRKREFFSYICSKNEEIVLEQMAEKKDYLDTIAWSIKESAQKADRNFSETEKYKIEKNENESLLVTKNKSEWLSKFFIEDNYIFSLAISKGS